MDIIQSTIIVEDIKLLKIANGILILLEIYSKLKLDNRSQPLYWHKTTFVKYFPGGLVVNNPPTMQETQETRVQSGRSLEEEMATYSSILAWKIPWTEDLGGLQSMGSQSVRQNWAYTISFIYYSVYQIFKKFTLNMDFKDKPLCTWFQKELEC